MMLPNVRHAIATTISRMVVAIRTVHSTIATAAGLIKIRFAKHATLATMLRAEYV